MAPAASKLTPAAKRRMNEALYSLTAGRYFEALPLAEIASIVERAGASAHNISGVYCGGEGRDTAQVADNCWLTMTWYRMPSGRFEVVAYAN